MTIYMAVICCMGWEWDMACEKGKRTSLRSDWDKYE